MSGSSTQPFSEGHVEQRLLAAASEETGGPGPLNDGDVDVDRLATDLGSLHVDTHFPADTRLLVHVARADAHLAVWKLGQRLAQGPPVACDPLAVNAADKPVLLLRQTASDVGHHLSVSVPPAKDECRLQIVYDGYSERLLVVNASSRALYITPQHLAGAPAPAGPTRIAPNGSIEVQPGVYAVRATPLLPPIVFRVLPKRPLSISNSPGSAALPQQHASSTGKRPAPADTQAEGDAAARSKHHKPAIGQAGGRAAETSGTNAVMIQLNPLLAVGQDASSLQNPFLGLEPGTVVHVPGTAGGQDSYTLTRGQDIAQTKGARLFLATHSNVSGETKVVVVKVLKNEGRGQRDLAELWLRETKAHARVSIQSLPTVCRLHAADARFLAIYMQHIAGSSLASAA
ncbi:hypothetical protein QBC39DRAFT_415588 [Podospora conica]|nr:hypothetical protein QBC39DRAFT_415588 [Schizothecium conicum]